MTILSSSSTAPAAESRFAFPEPAPKEMAPAEYVRRSVTVTLVVTVVELPLLVPVQRIVRYVYVKRYLLRSFLVKLHKQL